MTTRRTLQIFACLAGLRLACPARDPAPDAQVGVLTEVLLHLLSGMEDSGHFVEQQGRRVAQELRRQAQEVSRLCRRTRRVDRLWAGLKRELQVGAAREEGLQRGVESLQALIGGDTLERRLARVRELVQVITAPGEVKALPLNIPLLQAKMEAQGRRLSNLTLEVMILDELVAQQDQHVAELQASETREELQSLV